MRKTTNVGTAHSTTVNRIIVVNGWGIVGVKQPGGLLQFVTVTVRGRYPMQATT